jgi:hypothetical protein
VSLTPKTIEEFLNFSEKRLTSEYVDTKEIQKEFVRKVFGPRSEEEYDQLAYALGHEFGLAEQTGRIVRISYFVDENRTSSVYTLGSNATRTKIDMYKKGKKIVGYELELANSGIVVKKDSKDFNYDEIVGRKLVDEVIRFCEQQGCEFVDRLHGMDGKDGTQKTEDIIYFFNPKDLISFKLESSSIHEADGIGDAHGPDPGGTTFDNIVIRVKGKNVQKIHSDVEELEKLLDIKS